MKLSVSLSLWVVCFLAAWAAVGLDVQSGQRTAPGTLSGIWLALQAVGFGLSRLGIGIPDGAFWRTCADAPDGGIDNLPNRRIAWFIHGLLDHFSLIQYPKGVHAISARMKKLD